MSSSPLCPLAELPELPSQAFAAERQESFKTINLEEMELIYYKFPETL